MSMNIPRSFIIDGSGCDSNPRPQCINAFDIKHIQDKNRRLHCTSENSASCVSSRNQRVDNVRQTISIKSTLDSNQTRLMRLKQIQFTPKTSSSKTCSTTFNGGLHVSTQGDRIRMLKFQAMMDPRTEFKKPTMAVFPNV